MWRNSRWRHAAAVVALVAGLAVAPAPFAASATATANATLPACRYDDLLTAHQEYEDWPRSLLDPIFMLPEGYVPNDLVSVGGAGIAGRGKIRRVAFESLHAMTTAARATGAPLAVVSAYRSKALQGQLFSSYARRVGFADAALVSARPGHSEHQLGTTIDFKSAGGPAPWLLRDWAKTKAGAWMRDNAWRFGWVMSYPRGSSPSVTCYRHEPWHYRYFGLEPAQEMHVSGVTSREWLWHNDHGTPGPTPSPTPTRSPSPTPTRSPSPTPTRSPSPTPSPTATSSATRSGFAL